MKTALNIVFIDILKCLFLSYFHRRIFITKTFYYKILRKFYFNKIYAKLPLILSGKKHFIIVEHKLMSLADHSRATVSDHRQPIAWGNRKGNTITE